MSNCNKGHSDSLVKERRLRPIYELLDSNNNKRVVQEVDRLLKKQPSFTCAKVLKALALLRLGKVGECLSIITPIFYDTPTDENTIQALSICYRELDQPEMVCKLLERASTEDRNEDLMTHCFMAHVRVSDFQKQHQTAMKLYKMYPKIPYFSWAVMSLLVKVERDTDPLTLTVSLPLAERMMSKFIEENKIESEHEYCLYILILKKQRNYDKILDIMNGPNGKKISVTTGFYHRIIIECLKEKNDTTTLISFLEEAITQQPDEWKFYKQYIEYFTESESGRVRNFLNALCSNPNDKLSARPVLLSQLLFIKTASSLGVDHQMDISKILTEYMTAFGHRPFFFADIKFSLQFFTNQDEIKTFLDTANKLMPDPIRYTSVDDIQRKMNNVILTRYFNSKEINRCASKALDFVQMCVKLYLDARDEQVEAGSDWCSRDGLPQDDFMTLAGMTLMDTYWSDSSVWKGYFDSCSKSVEEFPQVESVKGERRILLEKLNSDEEFSILFSNKNNGENSDRKIGTNSEDHTEKDFQLVEIMKNSNDKEAVITNGFSNSIDLNKTVFAPSEEEVPILLSMAILEFVLERSPNLSQVRLLLAKAYMRCGAIGAGADIVIGLDLKHIQWESLGYLYIWKLQTSGFYREAVRILQMAENFYTTYQKESMEHVLSAYKYGSWEKILEFLEFRDLLMNSVQFGLITVEKELFQYTLHCYHNQTLKVAREMEIEQISQHFSNFERYTDNRDVSVLLTYGDKVPSDSLRKITFEAEVERLKIRSMLLSLITNFVLVPSLDTENYKSGLVQIENMLPKLKKLAENDYSAFNIPTPSFDEMWSPNLHRYVSAGYLNLLLNIFSLNLEMAKDAKDAQIKMLTSKIQETVTAVVNDSIKMWAKNVSSYLFRAEVIEDVFMLTETLGFCCILMDVCGALVKKNVPLIGKTKRKRSRESNDSAYYEYFNALLDVLSEVVTKVEKEILSFDFVESGYPIKWSELNKFWSGKINSDLHTFILPFSLPKVMAKLNQSYSKSIREMAANIQLRQKYIEGLYIRILP